MERKLASIQKVEWVREIEGADAIELVGILGWQAVVRKAENFKVNDLVVFLEIDSLLPDDHPDFAFMEKSKFRIKTRKMMKEVSQGLVMPLTVLNLQRVGHEFDTPFDMLEVGWDVTDTLGVKKWEPPAKFNTGDVQGNFPFYVPKTDEIRVQSALGVLDELRGVPSFITVKVDGTSATYSMRDEDFLACSRNLSWKPSEDSIYWRIARKYDLEARLRAIGNYAIQGEICGQGIQKNRLGLSELDIFVFDVYDIDAHKYLDYVPSREFIADLGLKDVPGIVSNYIFQMDLEQLLAEADGKYSGTYLWGSLTSEKLREGIVVRPMKETYSEALRGRLSFKIISNLFLLKESE